MGTQAATSASLVGYSGYYGGCTIQINTSSSHPYIYVGSAMSGTYYKKASGGSTFTIDADTISTSKTIYIIRSSTDMGSLTSLSFTSGPLAYEVPRFAMQVYVGSSTPHVISWTSTSGTIDISDYGISWSGNVLLGWSTQSTWPGSFSNYLEVGSLSCSSGPTYNGTTMYACISMSEDMTYYRGSSAARTASMKYYKYGKGLSSPIEMDEPTRTCSSDSTYSFLGWSSVRNSIDYAYSTLQDAANDGYTTVYGVYEKAGSTSNSTVYYYRGSSIKNSVTKTTVSETAYIYGTGLQTGGSETSTYGSVSTNCASDSTYSFQGWATSSSSTSIYSTDAATTFAAGYTTIYGVFKKDSTSSASRVYYYRGSRAMNTVVKTTTVGESYYYGTGTKQEGATSYSYGDIDTTCATDDTYTFKGWTGDSSSQTVEYTSAASAFDTYTTIYGIYTKDSTSSDETYYYYRGNNTKNSVAKTTTTSGLCIYGTGQSSGGETTVSWGAINTSCAVSGWTFLGFAANTNTQSSTSSAIDLFEGGNTTVYGTYSKTESMTYYPENGDESGTVSTTNYLYGTGSTTNNYPVEPSLSKAQHTLAGWATTSESETYSTWSALWDDGERTVYAIWNEEEGNVYYGINGVWKMAKIYYGVNGVWVPASAQYGINNVWN